MKLVYNNPKVLENRKLHCKADAEKYTWDRAVEKIFERIDVANVQFIA